MVHFVCVSGEVGWRELDIHKAADNLWIFSLGGGTATDEEKCLNFNGESRHQVNVNNTSHKFNVFIFVFYCLITVKA
jgi:hypothetical protein